MRTLILAGVGIVCLPLLGAITIISSSYISSQTIPCCNNSFPSPPGYQANEPANINCYDGLPEHQLTCNECALFWSAYLKYGETDPAKWLCPALPSPIEALPSVPVPDNFDVFVTEEDNPEIIWTHYYVHEYRIERKIGSGSWSNIVTIYDDEEQTYIDEAITVPDPKGRTIYYRMRGKVYDAYSDYTDEKIPVANVERLLPKKLVDDHTNSEALPQKLELLANYPNPFNATTAIRFQLPSETQVTLKIFNLLGEVIRTLTSGRMQPGMQQVAWDGTDQTGRKVASGVYIYQIIAGELRQALKTTLAY